MHFEAVIDKFPHDAVLSFSTPLELNDNTISALLHSILRSASIKSSTSSLRHPALEEITEDVGEVDERAATATEVSTVKDNGHNASTTPRQSLSRNNSVSSNRTRGFRSLSSSSKHRHAEKSMQLGVVQDSENTAIGTNRSAHEISTERPESERRGSSQSTRHSLRESLDSFGHQKKIKLGPRPSVDRADSRSGRPPLHSHNSEPRQVSTLPLSVRVPARQAVPSKVLGQSQPHAVRSFSYGATTAFVQSEPVELDGSDRPHSSGSVASVPAHNKVHEPKPPALTPEKQRLMKALQIRQRRLEMRPLKSPRLDESACSPALSGKLSSEHDSVDSIQDRSLVDMDSGVVHVFVKHLTEAPNTNPEASPVSTTDPSDGPSTQASSVADVEESKPRDVQNGVLSYESTPDQKSPDLGLTIAPTNHHIPSEPSSTDTVRNPVDEKLPSRSNSPLQIPLLEATSNEATVPEQSPILADTTQEQPVHPTTVHQNSIEPLPNTTQPKEEAVPQIRSPSRDTSNSHRSSHNDKRRASVDPIKVRQSGEVSDEHYLSDEAFMEELQSATVQEAKPMSVSRSPITPVFPKSPTKSIGNRSSTELSRTMSNNPAGPSELRRHLTPDMSDKSLTKEKEEAFRKLTPVGRAVSSPLRSFQQQEISRTLSPPISPPNNRRSISVSPSREPARPESPLPLLKKVGVSSGISQRIKALEKFSSAPESATSSKYSTPNISPTFVTQRKTSINTPPSTTTSPPPQTAWGFRRKLPYPSPSPSPQTPNSLSSKVSLTPLTAPTSKKPAAESSATMKKCQPNTISVTARIIRNDPNEKPEIPLNPSEPAPLNLHQSPLVVEHNNAVPEPPSTVITPLINKPSKSSRSPSAKSLSPSTSPDSRRDAAPPTLRRNSTNSRRSTHSRRNSDAEHSRPLSGASSNGVTNTEKPDEKKSSRTSRLFKRMSTIGNASRRSIAHALSPSLREEDPIDEHADVEQVVEEEEEVKAIDVGDVNVQFPDTLLWKRRHMELDGQGFLVLERCQADHVCFTHVYATRS